MRTKNCPKINGRGKVYNLGKLVNIIFHKYRQVYAKVYAKIVLCKGLLLLMFRIPKQQL